MGTMSIKWVGFAFSFGRKRYPKYYEDYFYVDNEDDSDGRAQNVGREDMTHEQRYWFQLANIENIFVINLSSTDSFS
jgi:hypothetical protein